MITMLTNKFRARDWVFFGDVAVALLLVAGLVLSLLSHAEICTTACAEGHKYRLYGFKFEPIGILFFTSALAFFAVQLKWKILQPLFVLMIFSSVGAELKFILVQKYIIKAWCPICLTIASCVGAVAAIYAYRYFNYLNSIVEHGKRSQIMKTIRNGFGSFVAIIVGFVVAAAGITKYEPSFAESLGNETPFFGNPNSKVEVYIFTDWFCPACAKVEDKIEKDFHTLTNRAKVTFVDVPVHQESYNFVPYNLSFMLKDKNKYIQLRHKLHELAKEDESPSDSQVEAFAKPMGVNYEQLDYAQVNLGLKYFKKLAKKFDVSSTPTVVIFNSSNKKAVKLKGFKEISDANFPELIKNIQ